MKLTCFEENIIDNNNGSESTPNKKEEETPNPCNQSTDSLEKESSPFPEIAVGLGGEGAAEAIHLDAEGLDVGDVPRD